MDFRDWEKIDEDDHSVTLQHPKGHVMTVAVKSLPKMMQEQIKRLKFAKGGDVLDSGEGGESEQGRTVRYANKTGSKQEMESAKEEAKGRAKMSRALPKPKLKGLAKGGVVKGVHKLSRKKGESEAGSELRDMRGTREDQMNQSEDIKAAHQNVLSENRKINPKLQGLAEGGEVKYKNAEVAKQGEEKLRAKHAAANTPEKKAKNDKFWGDAERDLKQTNGPGFKRAYYADGPPEGEVQQSDASQQSSGDTSDAKHTTNVYVNAAPPGGQPPTQAPMNLSAGTNTPPPEAPVVQPVNGQPTPNGTLTQEAKNTLDSVESGRLGNAQQAEVDAAKARAAVPAAQEALQRTKDTAAGVAAARNEIDRHTNEFNDWMTKDTAGNPGGNGTINPKRYVESMTTNQKVGNAIALALGGFGTAFGGHNFAFDHIQNQIDRDVKAQQQSVDNRKTVLGAWQQLYGDNNISLDLAKASTNDIYAKRIDLAAKQVGTPQAEATKNIMNQKLGVDSELARSRAAGLLHQLRSGGGQGGLQGAPQQMAPPSRNNGGAAAGSAPASGAVNAPPAHKIYSILRPGASDMVQQIAKNNPQFSERSKSLHDQLEQAQRVEAVLNGPNGDGVGGIDDLYDQMYKAVGSGEKGWNTSANHVRRNLEDSAQQIPYVGGAAKAFMDVVPKDSEYQAYELAHGALTSDLGTALSKILPPSHMEHMAEPNMPQYKDSLADKERKKQYMLNTILKTAQFPDLDQAGVTVKKKGK